MPSAIDLAKGHRSGRLSSDTLAFIPAETVVKPLRDVLLVEALDVVHSTVLIIPQSGKPVRGRVLAAGPGTYPKKYDHPEKHKRTKMWDSKRFQPTEVKVGDEIEVGGAENGGYAFETVRYGDKLCFWCREADVAGLHDP